MTTFNGIGSYKSFFVISIVIGLAACSNHEASTAPTANVPPASTSTTAPTMAAPAPATTLTVTKVDLGTAIGPDMSVAAPSKTFKPADTIYAAIAADGHGSNVALKTRWKYQDGSVVNTSTQMISDVAGHSVTDFHISNPAGWPAGKYSVEVIVDGKTISTAEFTVVP